MPFRSVEFGDSIINMKSVLTAQSPWWYQLKTAPFSWHFSCCCFFPFSSFSFHGKSFPWQWWPRCHHAPVPCSSPRARLPQAGGSTLLSPLLLPSVCAPQLALRLAIGEHWDLSPISLGVTVQGRAELPALPPAESPLVSPPCCCRGSGLPPHIIWQISR